MSSISTKNSERKILHIDMDCFFASVEMRDNPNLAGMPVAVGSAGRRGVVLAANYEARKYKVRSGIGGFKAKQLCKNLVFVKPRFSGYKADADTIKGIFKKYSPTVRSGSIDEAYLDISGLSRYGGSATLTAKAIKEEILETTGLSASAGGAPNKFLAKVASDFDKPDGLTIITPENMDSFLVDLPVEKIPGVGRTSYEVLTKHGIRTCGDLRQFSEEKLIKTFGKFGRFLHKRAYGVDESRVDEEYIRKSFSIERTFSKDLESDLLCIKAIEKLFIELKERMGRAKVTDKPIKSVLIKVKFSNFKSVTRQSSVLPFVERSFVDLILKLRGETKQSIRLLGVGVGFDSDKPKDIGQKKTTPAKEEKQNLQAKLL